MDTDQFRNTLKNYPSSTLEEAEKLHALSETFPYSQLLHVLSARASKDHGLESQQNQLQLAAVYSADRGILKFMMNHDGKDSEIPVTPSPAVASSTNAVQLHDHQNAKNNSTPITVGDKGDSDDLATQVIHDVNELYKTRHNFEMMFVDNPSVQLVKSNSSSGDEPAKSKRERIIELSKALNAQPMTEGEEQQKAPRRRRLERKDIMDEIVLSKSKIEPANEKQKEQLEIIDQFIKTQPSISAAKEKPPHVPDGDLSTIKTGEFGDNIVSETLVELLLKQGKKDKAIEVLKKLIWKFPQKKSYFAAQIEELKK